VAVISVSGPIAVSAVGRFFQAANGQELPQQPLGRIVYGRWGGDLGEDLIVCRRKQNLVEVHCHGGNASVSQILENLTASGCQNTDWQEWLREKTSCPLEVEAHAALAEASTLRTATISRSPETRITQYSPTDKLRFRNTCG
jgi:tRNA U34 5-carboxymethylaminomethyl modifying GTPase MnmE/TrmE